MSTSPPRPGACRPFPAAPTNVPEWTVSELAGALKRTLEDAFGHVRLQGEVSGYRGPHGSGHVYFCLKDGGARIDAVIWKTAFARLRFRPEEGLEVVATGRITTFPGKSSYQIIVETLEPAGDRRADGASGGAAAQARGGGAVRDGAQAPDPLPPGRRSAS